MTYRDDDAVYQLTRKLWAEWGRRDQPHVRERYLSPDIWLEDTLASMASIAIDFCAPVRAHALAEDDFDMLIQTQKELDDVKRDVEWSQSAAVRAEMRAAFAEKHPFRNLGRWLNRKIG